ncbi:MAG: hydroxyethylthiazole kinase [Syntrophorhabdaceae bacterium]|nr:hydroxyethylthiazole kinase [Syntrophorhabdaceae bacterium]
MYNAEMARRAWENLKTVRTKRPLVHNITNYVVMNYTANALLSCGASPVMAHALEEVEEMVTLAQALVLNIGTLSRTWVEAMIKAGKRANISGIPVILDPVGSGATRFRTDTARSILEEVSVKVVRGNPSEIISLYDDTSESKTKGVDAVHTVEHAQEVALHLSKKFKTTVAITGAVDLVTDGERQCRIYNGHAMMGSITGTGCTATAIMGAFLAVDEDPFMASCTSLAYFGLAGEKAAEKSGSPGSFQIALLDTLYEIGEEDIIQGAKIAI